MELSSESFDAVAYEVEAHLRELRRLVSETFFFSDAQNESLKSLREELHTVEAHASALRHSLLTGQDPDSAGPIIQVESAGEQRAIDELQAIEARLGGESSGLSRRAQDRIEWMTDPELPPGLTRESLGDSPDPSRTWNIQKPLDDLPEGDVGGALVPAAPVSPRPTHEGGAAKTFEESEEPPRSP